MEDANKNIILLEGPSGSLPIQKNDKTAKQLAMLFESKCLGLGAEKAAKKYGFSRARYFQLLKAFKTGGLEAIKPQKTGPKRNYKRTESIVSQVIRHRFLDPDANAEVISQKMKQAGYDISTRSVERIITEYGLQKKTL